MSDSETTQTDADDDLDAVQDAIRQHVADAGTHNYTDTQGFIATRNVWTMTEAAELLASHFDADTVAGWTQDDRSRAVADIVGRMIRSSLAVSPIRDELLADGQ